MSRCPLSPGQGGYEWLVRERIAAAPSCRIRHCQPRPAQPGQGNRRLGLRHNHLRNGRLELDIPTTGCGLRAAGCGLRKDGAQNRPSSQVPIQSLLSFLICLGAPWGQPSAAAQAAQLSGCQGCGASQQHSACAACVPVPWDMGAPAPPPASANRTRHAARPAGAGPAHTRLQAVQRPRQGRVASRARQGRAWDGRLCTQPARTRQAQAGPPQSASQAMASILWPSKSRTKQPQHCLHRCALKRAARAGAAAAVRQRLADVGAQAAQNAGAAIARQGISARPP